MDLKKLNCIKYKIRYQIDVFKKFALLESKVKLERMNSNNIYGKKTARFIWFYNCTTRWRGRCELLLCSSHVLDFIWFWACLASDKSFCPFDFVTLTFLLWWNLFFASKWVSTDIKLQTLQRSSSENLDTSCLIRPAWPG